MAKTLISRSSIDTLFASRNSHLLDFALIRDMLFDMNPHEVTFLFQYVIKIIIVVFIDLVSVVLWPNS